ncbi:MAG TPA: aminotransferase class V-fold PLP-dependent enzyme [Actinomycetes bacterium]|nr:aminotransferase class V-fold PLP-dependent enzyme [Actinomycetes bacterium]
MDVNGLLAKTAAQAASYLSALDQRPVGVRADRSELLARLGGPLPEKPNDADTVVDDLVQAADPGLIGSAGPRYYGFVVGGSLPSALAADWLTSVWDQNAGTFILSPAAAAVEEVAAGWLVELLGLPPATSVGFTTGATMANFICMAAARSRVLESVGWDVERNGLFGAPPIEVVVGADRHVSLEIALRYLGLGSERVRVVPADDQGRMRADLLGEELRRCDGPIIVCAQAGDVNSGAFDPLGQICDVAHEHGAWVHVDGAFGLWAAASPDRRHLIAGIENADSCGTDGHKWLNVPYDSGLAFVADPVAHRQAMSLLAASYLVFGEGAERDNANWVPEMSRRARGFPIWAAIRELGRSGIAEMVDRGCECARRFADGLGAAPGVEILNEVVLNQVLVRFTAPDGGDSDAFTREVVSRVQADGTSWLGGTTWQGKAAMRISVSNWSTTEADVDRSVEAILRVARQS